MKLKVDEIKPPTKGGGVAIQFSGSWDLEDWNGSAFWTGKDRDGNVIPFPSHVVEGATVECEVKKLESKSGGEWYPVSFPEPGAPQQAATGKSTSSTYGKSMAQVHADNIAKFIGMGFSYGKDTALETPEGGTKNAIENGLEFSRAMILEYKRNVQ